MFWKKKQQFDTLPIKANGIPIEYPTSWNAVKFKTFIKLINKTKIQSIRIILEDLGIPADSAQIQGLPLIMQASKFLDTTTEINTKPTQIGKYQLPTHIESETWDQYDRMGSLIRDVRQKSTEEQIEALAYYAAIYVQGFKEPFDPEKANYLAGEFMNFPCLEVLSAGTFFQIRYLSMESGLPMNSLYKNILGMKKKQGLKRFLKHLEATGLRTASRDM